MVYYSDTATTDFKQILLGLMTWEKRQLEYERALSYVDDIYAVCESLANKIRHQPAYYENHKNYGNYVYAYKRNRATTWYIVYNVIQNDVHIEKIISNYLTVE